MLRVREPVERPLDVIAAELGVTISQSLLAGLLVYLATGFWADRGVVPNSVVAIFAIAAVAVAGSWLYWLLGGEGWPMAVSCLPVGLVLAFAVLLSARGDHVAEFGTGVTILAIACAVYGIVAGVFLDSPRRWRWDQRRELRAGTSVPRLSPAAERAIARVPRRMPTVRSGSSVPDAERSAGTAHAPPVVSEASDEAAAPVVRMASPRPPSSQPEPARRPQASVAGPSSGTPLPSPAVGPPPPLGTAAAPSPPPPPPAPVPAVAPRTGIELPTTDEPRTRRSPWAWASPPEWSRDDLDEEAAAEHRPPVA